MILPTNKFEVVELLNSSVSVNFGAETHNHGAVRAGYGGMNQIIDLQLSDQLVIVQPGLSLKDLNLELSRHGFEVPYARDSELSIGDHLALNHPHSFVETEGSWRDWTTRLEMVLADGSIVVSGANVVKSVSGFDLHKLMIGARGTLGVITEVTLRIRPQKQRDADTETKMPDLDTISPTVQELMIRTKEIFDPAQKLNPGEFGFL